MIEGTVSPGSKVAPFFLSQRAGQLSLPFRFPSIFVASSSPSLPTAVAYFGGCSCIKAVHLNIGKLARINEVAAKQEFSRQIASGEERVSSDQLLRHRFPQPPRVSSLRPLFSLLFLLFPTRGPRSLREFPSLTIPLALCRALLRLPSADARRSDRANAFPFAD